jgi:hypothetical protein
MLIKANFMNLIKSTQNPFWVGVINTAFDACCDAVNNGINLSLSLQNNIKTRGKHFSGYATGMYYGGSCKGHSIAIMQCIQMKMIDVTKKFTSRNSF